MWRRLRLVEPSAAVRDLTTRRDAELLAALALLGLPLCAALAVLRATAATVEPIAIGAFAIALAIAWRLARAGRVRAGSRLVAFGLPLASYAVGLFSPAEVMFVMPVSLAVLVATVLLARREALGLAIGAALATLLVYAVRGDRPEIYVTGAFFQLALSVFGLAVARHRDRLELERRQELQAREAALAEARRHEAVGRLAGGIAHDFNNLLTVVLANASLIHRGREPGSHAREIESAAQRAAALVRQLLAFSRRQVMAARTLSLGAVLRDVEGILGRLLGEDVQLTIDVPAELWPVELDPTQLEQVILNLAANARDAMPDGGRLTIALRNASMPRDGESIDAVEVRITDTGVGMDADTLSHAFEPFFTTKGVGRGTGLGLASVRGIIEQSGGQIAVTSAPGQGTTFTIRLPRAAAAAVEADATAAPPPDETTGAPVSVLLVEDDELVRRAVLAILDEAGVHVTATSTAAEARRLFEANPERFGALIADVVMPQTSGPALAAELRRLRPDLPVVLLSGYSEAQVSARGPVPSGVRFVGKPFEAAELITALHAALERRAAAVSATAPTSAAPPPAR